ncbi:MAG: hypothetical protein RL011_1985 [Pseudomonadota bacterium]
MRPSSFGQSFSRLISNLSRILVPLALAGACLGGEAVAADTKDAPSAPVIKNERMRALDGSKSPWSGQFNLNYSGAPLRNPLSAEAPNPGNILPAPVVLMTGSFAVRNRLDSQTTMGLGAGIGTETPFQGPKNTRASDPYIDIARRYSLGPVMVRAGVSAKFYTNHRYRDVNGYLNGFGFFSDSVVEAFPNATLGLILNGYVNTFQESSKFRRQNQVETQFYIDPVFEYRFNEIINFRTMTAFTYAHTRELSPRYKYRRNPDFQQVGFGITAAQGLYFNVYAKMFPFGNDPVTLDNTSLGMSMILNLF